MSEPSVSNFANVVVIELLSGSRSTLPHSPVAGSTKFGAFPAAIEVTGKGMTIIRRQIAALAPPVSKWRAP